jgi:phosphoribosylaminoimidazolecarboxamide formyltransferase/IMP cyclohydrolase
VVLPIRTALLSVSDKTGVVALARALAAHGSTLVSTGGTRQALMADGLTVTDITQVTGNPEAFNGRMKTLSFQVASGILFDRDRDAREAEQLGITPIDLVVANLYPFAAHKDSGLSLPELIEYIDIGGPTMIRAAAKNFAHVAVLVRPEDYPEVIAELASRGGLTRATRRRLMVAAFRATADYDTMIAEHLAQVPLRYGENPHQRAAFIPGITGSRDGTAFEVLGGKELSYNNLVDLDAALAAAFDGPDSHAGVTCAIVKHENPCGLALAPTAGVALARAWEGDPVSAFGGVIAFNASVTRDDLALLAMDNKTERRFVEIVAAPDFTPEAVAYLAQNKNLRILRVIRGAGPRAPLRRQLSTGVLVQTPDETLFEKLEIVSKAQESLSPAGIAFALHAVRCVKSNGIVLVEDRDGTWSLLGMGAGQPNRVKSTELAVAQARENLLRRARLALGPDARDAELDAEVTRGFAAALLASDAFFPFADAVEHALAAGVRRVIEPGGSLRDGEVIAACDAAGATLVFTGTRHFKH